MWHGLGFSRTAIRHALYIVTLNIFWLYAIYLLRENPLTLALGVASSFAVQLLFPLLAPWIKLKPQTGFFLAALLTAATYYPLHPGCLVCLIVMVRLLLLRSGSGLLSSSDRIAPWTRWHSLWLPPLGFILGAWVLADRPEYLLLLAVMAVLVTAWVCLGEHLVVPAYFFRLPKFPSGIKPGIHFFYLAQGAGIAFLQFYNFYKFNSIYEGGILTALFILATHMGKYSRGVLQSVLPGERRYWLALALPPVLVGLSVLPLSATLYKAIIILAGLAFGIQEDFFLRILKYMRDYDFESVMFKLQEELALALLLILIALGTALYYKIPALYLASGLSVIMLGSSIKEYLRCRALK